MAEKKISQLTAKGATVADTDLLVVSEDAGGGSYTTKSVTGANIKGLVTDANLTTTDITTNDVSITKHGFVPKAPNDTAKFLRGDATWATVPAGGLTNFTEAENTAAPNGTVPVNSLTATGAATNIDAAIVPKGTGALLADIPDNATSGGNKRGEYAVDWQMVRNANTQVASGNRSIILGGWNNRSANNYAITGGNSCNATGDTSIALGEYASASGTLSTSFNGTASGSNSTSFNGTASGNYSFCAGGIFGTASGNYSFSAAGYQNTASGALSAAFNYQNVASGTSSFIHGTFGSTFGSHERYVQSTFGWVRGDGQMSRYVLNKRTTNNTTATLNANAYQLSPGADTQVLLQNNSALRFKGTIIGKKSGTTDIAAWDIDGLIVRGANAAATTLNVSNVTLVQNTPAWGTPALSADTTNGCLKVEVTGAASTNIQWTAVIETTEVIYA